jgi:mono/diheme cytochrome c family protein
VPNSHSFIALVATLTLAMVPGAAGSAEPQTAKPGARAKTASSAQIERGRYMILTGNCNDCHTANYPPRDGKVPEQEWLMGSGALGFRGPWGTTYAPNLRMIVKSMTEVQWVNFAKTLKTRPPMPWFNLNHTTEQDLRAMYQYIRQLGPAGEAAKQYLPPDKEPKPPYVQWPAPPRQN